MVDRRNRAWRECVAKVDAQNEKVKPQHPLAPETDAELIKKLKSVRAMEKSGNLEGQSQSTNSDAQSQARNARWQAQLDDDALNAKVNNIVSKCFKTVDVYHGQLTVAVKPPRWAVKEGTGQINTLEVAVDNQSPETRRVKFQISCGSWNKTISLGIEGNSRYDFGGYVPYDLGGMLLSYSPNTSDCTIYNLQLELLRRDVY